MCSPTMDGSVAIAGREAQHCSLDSTSRWLLWDGDAVGLGVHPDKYNFYYFRKASHQPLRCLLNGADRATEDTAFVRGIVVI